MCCQFPLYNGLGGPKGYIEVAETYRMKGHSVTIIGINEIVGEDVPFLDEAWRIKNFPKFLKEYILKNWQSYDVIEYEAIYLPFKLKDTVKAILVARSVLLEAHFRNINLPLFPGLKPFLSHLIKSRYRKNFLESRIHQSLEGMKFADVVNVSNPDDQKILEEIGIPSHKIVMQPYGITQKRYQSFQIEYNPNIMQAPIKIAFVGTFDKRKGAIEFPKIIKQIIKHRPEVKFKLLGVIGMFSSADEIYNYLGESLKENVEIIPKYDPKDLPKLLSDCNIGIFPSHLESFGFGVLEMMAINIPVVGYNSPGINMLIPKPLLAPRGDYIKLVNDIERLITEKSFYDEMKKATYNRVLDFIYENQTNYSLEKYYLLLHKE